jgi:sarcosine oxidase
MIRMAYFEHSDYVPLLKRAYELWDALERASGYKLLHITGGLYMGRPRSTLIAGALSTSKAHQLPHELWDREQVSQRFPQFSLPIDYHGFFEEQAGLLIPERVMCAHVEQALQHGAELHGHEPVHDWNMNAVRATVRTQLSTYTAERIVFAGGAWTSRLLSDLGIELTVTRQPLAWFWPRRPDRFALGAFPVWFMETEHGHGYYGFPMLPDQPGLKIALHEPAEPTDPDHVHRDAVPGDVVDLRSALGRYLPDASGPLLAMRVCLYTLSPDSHFIIDRHPRFPSISLACGFSGHGFKFAGVVGEALADLATVGTTDLPIDFLSLERFSPR